MAFEEYKELPKTAPLDLTEDDVTWIASNLSGAAGALGVEAIEMRSWLLRFGCASEELRVVIARLAEWMANSSPSWAAYHKLMICRLVALDRRPGLCPVGIGEALCRPQDKLVMRAAGAQRRQCVATSKYVQALRPVLREPHMLWDSVDSRG